MTLVSRITIRALLVMALTLGSVSLATYQLIRSAGLDDIDALLREESAQLIDTFSAEAASAAGLDDVLSGPEAERAARASLTVHPSSARHVAAISLADARLQASGGPPRVAALLRGTDAPPSNPGSLRSTDTLVGAIRTLDIEVTDTSGAPLAVVTVVAPLDTARGAATDALVRAALASAFALVIGSAFLSFVLSRSLLPLRELSAATKRITPNELAVRIPVPETGDEVQQLAEELNEMLERIDSDDRIRRQYLAAISHEVRTPLTVAEGHLEMLEQGLVDSATAAATTRHELDRLRRVLDDLLSVARNGDPIDIRLGPIFLPDLFAAVGERIDVLGLARYTMIGHPPAVAFTGDQARIEQSISNLIDNAFDHNPPGTKVTITAEVDPATSRVSIEVADDGNGIDPELLPTVREPFVTSRPSGRQRASGLGLTLVDSLTLAQGGRFDLASDSAGTRAILTYPAAL